MPPEFDINLELVAGLEEIAKTAGKTLPQLAIAWTLRRTEVTAAIVGGRRPEQVEEVVVAGDCDITKELITDIEDLLKIRQQEIAKL